MARGLRVVSGSAGWRVLFPVVADLDGVEFRDCWFGVDGGRVWVWRGGGLGSGVPECLVSGLDVVSEVWGEVGGRKRLVSGDLVLKSGSDVLGLGVVESGGCGCSDPRKSKRSVKDFLGHVAAREGLRDRRARRGARRGRVVS